MGAKAFIFLRSERVMRKEDEENHSWVAGLALGASIWLLGYFLIKGAAGL